MTMPRIKARVVCTLLDTIETLVPTSALMSVDLPTFGTPISATKPQRVLLLSGVSDIRCARYAFQRVRYALAFQQGQRGGLLGLPLAAADALGWLKTANFDLNAKPRIVMGAGAFDFAIGRRRHAAALGPRLQHRFRIAQRPHRLVQQPGP